MPLSISIPALRVGDPVTLEFKIIKLSSTKSSAVFKLTVSPCITRSPETVKLLSIKTSSSVLIFEVSSLNQDQVVDTKFPSASL